jgi:hypothetical protein
MKIPASYLHASPEVRAAVCNGCGAGGWKFDIVPDQIYGVVITDLCDVHDWEYTVGSTEEDRLTADQNLLFNILERIENIGGWLRWFRRRRAYKYYEAVREFGHDAYWKGKTNENR